MKTSLEKSHGWHAIALSGSLVLRNLNDARRAIEAFAERGGTKAVLDLTETTLVDSSGISFIINFVKHMREQKSTVVIVGANPDTRLVFSMVGLDNHVFLCDTRDQFEQILLDSPHQTDGLP